MYPSVIAVKNSTDVVDIITERSTLHQVTAAVHSQIFRLNVGAQVLL